MIVLQCVNVSKAFGAEPILENVKLEVQSKDRVALVGRNGAGKSTLLKIIVGEMSTILATSLSQNRQLLVT